MSKHKRLSNVNAAEVIEVVKVTSTTGEGTKEDVVRIITEYFSLEGKRLARVDTTRDNVEEIHEWTDD